MNFYSETYHESIQYIPRSNGDPISMHLEDWNVSTNTKFEKSESVKISASKFPVHNPVSFDACQTVGVYVLKNEEKKVYYFDSTNEVLIPLKESAIVEKIFNVFPEKETLKECAELYIYTAQLENILWKAKENAYHLGILNVGSAVANTMFFLKSQGKRAFLLGGFQDAELSSLLELSSCEFPLATLVVFPEKSLVAVHSIDEGMGEAAYSNRREIIASKERYEARFKCQYHAESIVDLNSCVKMQRIVSKALPGDEFPLTPSCIPLEKFLSELWFLKEREKRNFPFKRITFELDEFSTILRALEICPVNAFAAGLLNIWVIPFDVLFVFSGVYRYIPYRKSLYMQAGAVNVKKFVKCFMNGENAENTSFAILLTGNLNEACALLGERAYRYLNLNAGFLLESLDLSTRLLHKTARIEHFYYEAELKNVCELPLEESIFAVSLIGKTKPQE